MKVLHILSTTSASRGDLAVVMNYFRNIDRSTVTFDFATMFQYGDEVDEEIVSLGGKSFLFNKPSLRAPFKIISELRKIIIDNAYDVVHLHLPTLHYFVKKAIKGTNIKLVIHSHSSRLSSKMLGRIRNRLLVTGVSCGADARFSCSMSSSKNLYGKSWGNKENDYLLKNAVDMKKFVYDPKLSKNLRKELGVNDKIAFCHVGRFSEEKNHTRLIDIFNEIYKKEKNVHLFLIGDGPLKNSIQEKVNELGLQENVTFMGKRKDVSTLLKAMDVYLLPSLFEGLSVSLVEAQASGLLCFYSDSCSKESEITDNIYSISLKDDSESWAKFILDKYHEGWCRDVSEKVKQNGYDIEFESKKLLKKYKEIINA